MTGLSACHGASNVKKPSLQTGVDSACLDRSQQYQPIKGLIGSHEYNTPRKFYSPVKGKNGIIKYDFNHDNAIDYVFLERKPRESVARLVLCMSNKKSGYARVKTAFSVREFKFQNNYVEAASIVRKGDSLTLSDSNHAHNDGGENRISLFTFNPKRHAFTLRKYEYISYGQAFPEIYQTFDLQHQRYSEEKGCSYAADSASISYEPNCKPHKISLCLRDDGVIFLGRPTNHDLLRKRVVGCH